MQVLVIGSGGREHAIASLLARSPHVSQLFCAPGNAGIAQIAKCVPLVASDIEGLLRFATVNNMGLTVVGPEVPLVAGIVDQFQAAGLMIFGPTAAAAQLEGSKAWTKQLLVEAGIPTATAQVFREAKLAIATAQTHTLPVVVKADGLAAGKGVTVAQTHAEAVEAIEALFSDGPATVVLESFLAGQEVSVLALTDGETIRTLLPAQDHKRIGDGDTGPNTGGMGAYAPAPLVDTALMARIEAEILYPTLRALQARGILYQGVLYAGLMISPQGDPSVVEFNCRFGDPETQAVLPLLDTDLYELLRSCCTGTLASQTLQWRPGAAACVVIASGGYPGRFVRGKVIRGLAKAAETALVFHAGTVAKQSQVLSDGGRVLGITGLGETLEAAIQTAYEAVAAIEFEDGYYRRDIGQRALSA